MIRPPRTFEDLAVGEQRRSASRTITQDEIIAFGRLYDPQWFHSDVEAARESHFGEVIASGIHVLAIWRQLDHEINGDIDFVCGVGMDELRLKTALFASDRPLEQKMLGRDALAVIDGLADLAEEISDELSILAIKRVF